MAVGRESQGQTESIRAPPVVEETEVRDVRRELVTIEVPPSAGCWTWQEPTGPRRDARLPEHTENQGESRRKPPRQESPRLRNSSGSLTA